MQSRRQMNYEAHRAAFLKKYRALPRIRLRMAAELAHKHAEKDAQKD